MATLKRIETLGTKDGVWYRDAKGRDICVSYGRTLAVWNTKDRVLWIEPTLFGDNLMFNDWTVMTGTGRKGTPKGETYYWPTMLASYKHSQRKGTATDGRHLKQWLYRIQAGLGMNLKTLYQNIWDIVGCDDNDTGEYGQVTWEEQGSLWDHDDEMVRDDSNLGWNPRFTLSIKKVTLPWADEVSKVHSPLHPKGPKAKAAPKATRKAKATKVTKAQRSAADKLDRRDELMKDFEASFGAMMSFIKKNM